MAKKKRKKRKPAESRPATAEALVTPVPEPDVREEDDVASARPAAYLLSGGVFVLLVLGVYAYGRFGGPWVDGLDDRIGEVVAARANRYADTGMTQPAVEAYREALAARFGDPTQRTWVSQRFVRLLMEQGEYDEAAQVARAALAFNENDGVSHSQLNRALRQAGRRGEALESAESWFAWAEGAGETDAMTWAKYYAGWACVQLGRKDEALQAYLDGYAIRPGAENALAAARILVARKRYEEARPLLDHVIREGNEKRAREARGLKKSGGSSS